MNISWTRQGEISLIKISDHIALDSPFYAIKFIEDIERVIDLLLDSPFSGRSFKGNYRWILHLDYKIIYSVEEENIFIHKIVNNKRSEKEILKGLK